MAHKALALRGGPPVIKSGQHVRWPVITEPDRAAVMRVLDRRFRIGVEEHQALLISHVGKISQVQRPAKPVQEQFFLMARRQRKHGLRLYCLTGRIGSQQQAFISNTTFFGHTENRLEM